MKTTKFLAAVGLLLVSISVLADEPFDLEAMKKKYPDAFYVSPKAKQAIEAENNRPVRIFFSGGHYVTGSVVQKAQIITILFDQEPCSLPLADRDGMRRAWMAFGAYQLGCWYPTIDKNYVFVGQLASLTQSHGEWETAPRALLHKDGTATITEPNYDSATFVQLYFDRRNAHLFDHVNDRP